MFHTASAMNVGVRNTVWTVGAKDSHLLASNLMTATIRKFLLDLGVEREVGSYCIQLVLTWMLE